MKDVVIVSVARTPVGLFGGALQSFTAPQLGAIAIKGALEKINLDPSLVNEVFMGNVIAANLGQAPATQAATFAGLPNTVPSTTINKVCASGLKAIMLAAQSIQLGTNDVVVAGGMESMSNVPFYVDKARFGYKLGHGTFTDGLIKDGLWDVYNNYHMGNAAELCASTYSISREAQDAFAIQSYERSAKAWAEGKFKDEVVPVELKSKKGSTFITEDEEYKNVKFDKIPTLNPVFVKEGTVTAANASTLNDGASAVVLMSAEKAQELGLKPLAYVRGMADAQQAPEWFTTTPAKAIPLALKQANIEQSQVDFYEINEAFSVVSLANAQLLNLDNAKVNVNGGAVALGHPLGSSGSRIVVTLMHVLAQNNGKYGVAAICNGGGGASAMVFEKA